MNKLIFFSFGILFGLLSSTYADVYCGNKLVDTGITESDVLKYCVAPSKKESWQKIICNPINSYQCNIVNFSLWTYDLGSTQFIRYFHFREKILIDITFGDYGK